VTRHVELREAVKSFMTVGRRTVATHGAGRIDVEQFDKGCPQGCAERTSTRWGQVSKRRHI